MLNLVRERYRRHRPPPPKWQTRNPTKRGTSKMENSRTDANPGDQRKRPGYCLRFESVLDLGGVFLLLGWTTSGGGSRRWSVPHGSLIASGIPRSNATRECARRGLKIHGSEGEHPFFSWATKSGGGPHDYDLMIAAASSVIQSALRTGPPAEPP